MSEQANRTKIEQSVLCLAGQLVHANALYREGEESGLSDFEYDMLEKSLEHARRQGDAASREVRDHRPHHQPRRVN